MSASNEPTSYQSAILHGLQFKPVFGGILDERWAAVDKRRARNKRARAARRAQRVRNG